MIEYGVSVYVKLFSGCIFFLLVLEKGYYEIVEFFFIYGSNVYIVE